MSTPGKMSDGDAITEDVAVHLDSAVTSETMNRDKAKLALFEATHRFSSEPFTRTEGAGGAISKETAAAARALFEIVLPTAKIPKILPDGEGGLLLVWDEGNEPVILVVDNWTLHLVTAATTSQARYFDDLPFDGERLPSALGQAIPTY